MFGSVAETAQLAVLLTLKDQMTPGLKKAQGGLGRFESGIGRTSKGLGNFAKGMGKVGVVAAGAAVTGLAFAAKTAIEFDDAFAGVRKTVAASEPQLQALNDELHTLATRIPVKYTDLAAIAAEAGALGVPTESVAKFTETVARLSASTQGLTVEAAAEAFGKFRNILKLTDADLTRAASSLIALGNAGASSEGDIIEVAKRFGAAGHQAGLSAAQVLGFSSAIASLGVEPEAAGSSLSRLFNNITKYIGTGDKKIKAFAKTAGLSIHDFRKLFAKDATGAVELFLTNLGKLDRFEAANVLKNAGITNVRDINAVLLLSQNVGELQRQVDLSTEAFKENTELTDVSTKRFDTLKNKIIVLKNNFLEAGYNIAQGFLPALGRAAEKLTAFLQVPGNKTALRKLGEDIGKLIDGIDWDQLLNGAKSAVALLGPVASMLASIASTLNALPTELKAAGLAAILANKASGGLILGGLSNALGGLGETFARTLLTKVPLFGSAFVQPVFVTNMGPGLGGGPGGGGAPGIAPAVGKAGFKELLGAAGAASLAGVVGGVMLEIGKTLNENILPDVARTGRNPFNITTNMMFPGLDTLTHLDELPAQLNRFVNAITGNKPQPTTVAGAVEFRAGERASETAKNWTPKPIVSAVDGLKQRLTELQQRLARAKDQNDSARVARIQAKIEATKARLAAAAEGQKMATTRGSDIMKQGDATIAQKLGVANTNLVGIRHKRTSFTVNNRISTYVSVRDIDRSSTYKTKVARTTQLVAQ